MSGLSFGLSGSPCFKVAPSHCQIASKNIRKKKHKKKKKKTKHDRKKHKCKDTQCIWGPLQPFFLKVASSHCHIASKNIRKRKKTRRKRQKMTEKNTNAKTPNASFEERYRKKQQMQKHPMHLEGKRLSLTHHEENQRE